MARGEIDPEDETVLEHVDPVRARTSPQRPRGRLEALLETHLVVAAVHDPERCKLLDQDLNHIGQGTLGGQRERLHDQPVAVAVDNQPGQPVGLSVHQPIGRCGRVRGEPGTRRDRTLEATTPQGGVGRLVGVPGERPHDDLGLRVQDAAGDEPTVRVENIDHRAVDRAAFDVLDRAREQPWVALAQGPLTAPPQDDPRQRHLPRPRPVTR